MKVVLLSLVLGGVLISKNGGKVEGRNRSKNIVNQPRV